MTKIKPNILEAKCIIIKIGSSLLIEKKKFNKEKLNEIILDIYKLKKRPKKNLASFSQFFGPFLGIFPPCLWLYLKQVCLTLG